MQNLNQIVEPLLVWYQKNKRELPWRKEKTPYSIWVSEIMLQQTRIEAVKKYYQKWMKRLPNIQSLANINEEELLKLWEGLGYYSRARNLKKAAQIIQNQYNGKIPNTYSELIKLPGIGEYTAGAIASIAFKQKVPAVDGNVLRIVSRITGDRKDILLPETKKQITKKITEIMPNQAGIFNEALMELGETICLPKGEALCNRCPLQNYCIAYQKQIVKDIPVRNPKMRRKQMNLTVLVWKSKQGKIAIQKREKKGLLAGMYQFPNIEGNLNEKELEQYCLEKELTVIQITDLKEYKHVFTHMDWLMHGYLIEVEQENKEYIWIFPEELETKYAVPSAFKPFKEKLK